MKENERSSRTDFPTLESWFLPTVSVTFWSDLRFGCFCSWVAGVPIPAHLLHNQASSQQSAGGRGCRVETELVDQELQTHGWIKNPKRTWVPSQQSTGGTAHCFFLETRHLVAAFIRGGCGHRDRTNCKICKWSERIQQENIDLFLEVSGSACFLFNKAASMYIACYQDHFNMAV
jgi:hypothetical protein